MKRTCLLAAALVFAITGSSYAAEVLWEDNAPPGEFTFGGGGNFVLPALDPEDATNDVGEVILSGTSKFTNVTRTDIDLTEFPDAPGLSYQFSMDYFVPLNTNLDDNSPGGDSPDLFWLQLDIDGSNTGSAGFIGATAAGTGWNTISFVGENPIPLDATIVKPLLVFADGGFGAGTPNADGASTTIFIDNFRFETLDPVVGLPGDYNADGTVDTADYTVWRANLGAADEAALNGGGDGVNGVDEGDFTLWRTNYGSNLPVAASSASVPEPSTAFLALLGLAAMCGAARRRK